MLLMAVPLAIVFVFAPEILHVWLGDVYAARSADALRLLSIGVFINALANPLFVALYAKNRPDLPAKFHVAELVIHIPLTIALIHRFGVTGAAAAWTVRVTIDMGLLWWGAVHTSGASALAIIGGRTLPTMASIVALVAALTISRALMNPSLVAGVLAAALSLALFGAWSWRAILSEDERAGLRGTARSYLRLTPESRLVE
jgi:O-antigen/teichoic acid export membrane protein